MDDLKHATGADTINLFLKYVDEQGGEPLRSKVQVAATIAQLKIYDINSRVMGCHCESMGMNAENMLAAIANKKPPYGDEHYKECAQRWGLVDETGKPKI